VIGDLGVDVDGVGNVDLVDPTLTVDRRTRLPPDGASACGMDVPDRFAALG
jgi:hypothetical protein